MWIKFFLIAVTASALGCGFSSDGSSLIKGKSHTYEIPNEFQANGGSNIIYGKPRGDSAGIFSFSIPNPTTPEGGSYLTGLMFLDKVYSEERHLLSFFRKRLGSTDLKKTGDNFHFVEELGGVSFNYELSFDPLDKSTKTDRFDYVMESSVPNQIEIGKLAATRPKRICKIFFVNDGISFQVSASALGENCGQDEYKNIPRYVDGLLKEWIVEEN